MVPETSLRGQAGRPRATWRKTVPRSGGFCSPDNADDTGAANLDKADLAHQADEGVDLVARPGDLEDEAVHGRVDHLGAEDVGEAHRLGPVLARSRDLDQCQLALDEGAGLGEVDAPVDGH